MTVQEAIKEIVKEVCEGCKGSDEPQGDCKRCGYKIAIESMEKQIPKKPIKTPMLWGSEKRCPSCNEAFRCSIAGYKIEEAIGNIKYCYHCGQKLGEEGGTSD